MEGLLSRLLTYYGLTKEEYEGLILPPSFNNIPQIGNDIEVKKAIERLNKAKERKEKILIYGDYDVDGISSASILLRSFKEYGLDCAGYIPSRYLDGYGLTVNNVKKIAAKGYSIIFTCDNGVTAHEALLEAKRLGIEVIILDHHEFDEIKPEADIIIHPITLSYGEVPISAGFLSFVFSVALLGRVDDFLLSLGAISTISDMMPLKAYNREIVRLMLNVVNKNRYQEFTLLSDAKTFDASTFQMTINPKLNSIGRLEKGTEPNRLLAYFGNPDSDKEALAHYINEVYERRKEVTKESFEKLSINEEEPAIIVEADIPEGLNGLLASRLLTTYHKPVVVFSSKENEEKILVGSMRSEEGFDVLKALEGTKVELLSKGGHPFAGGVSIRKEDFAAFKKDYLYAAVKHKLSPKQKEGIPLSLGECTMQSYRTIETFAPFGFGWESPKFLLTNLDPRTFTYIKEGKYLATKISTDSRLFSFALGIDSFEEESKVDFVATFKINEYKGRKSLDIICEKAF